MHVSRSINFCFLNDVSLTHLKRLSVLAVRNEYVFFCYVVRTSSRFILLILPEVILSLLLESFTFSLSEKEIIWNLGALQTPSIEKSKDGKPQLPLKVALVS